MSRWLTVDPGESTGWSVWEDKELVDAGTTPMMEFADDVWNEKFGKIDRIVCEDWRIYPWEAKKGSLNWDQCRTARLIGVLAFIARLRDHSFILQPAAIKERAIAGGAKELFYRPLHENRHQNDAIMHGWFFVQVELLGANIPKSEENTTAHHPV